MVSFPPALLIEGRRVPGSSEVLKRLIRALDVQPGERVLVVGAGEGAALRALARDAGAQVTALEWEPRWAAACEVRVREEGLSARVTVRTGEPSLFDRPAFDVVLVDTLPPPGPIGPFAQQLRGLLVTNGRLGLTLPVAVGLQTTEAVRAYWAEVLGAPLVRPAALLSQIEQVGYEPQWAEALSEELMAEHYRQLEEQLPEVDAALRERLSSAVDLFRAGPGRTGASYAMLALRRREPGEKPPPARTAG